MEEVPREGERGGGENCLEEWERWMLRISLNQSSKNISLKKSDKLESFFE